MNPLAFYLPNHSSSALTPIPFAELIALPQRPNIFANKKDFVDWSHNPSTEHCYYSLFEPAVPGQRLTKDNPPAFLHGIVADYDIPNMGESEVGTAIARCSPEYPMAYCSRTFSGGMRAIWLFESKVPVFNLELAKSLLLRLKKELKLLKLAPGLDEPALLDPAKVFELGNDWRALNPSSRIPSTALTTWAFEASQKTAFEGGPAIPMAAIAAEVERQFPGRWHGPFEVGAKGVRFWDPSALDDNGAWIRDNGVQAFSGEGKFLHWDEILGKPFVKKFTEDKIGNTIGNIYYDNFNKSYWLKDDEGWGPATVEVLRRRFHNRGLATQGQKGAQSEVDQALCHIEENCKVAGSFPFLYCETDTVRTDEGKKYLNISSSRVMTPLPGPRTWGQDFPTLGVYFKQLFSDDEQLEVFLSWLAFAYRAGLNHKAHQGHALFIVGPTSVGKTYLSGSIVGKILGGSSEVTDYILGEDKFNGNTFCSPVWTVDDGEVAVDRRTHDLYSAIVKKLVANPKQTYRRMYADGVTLPWCGRLIVTLNDDAISMLPNIEANLLDKVIFLRVQERKTEIANFTKLVPGELAAFCSFLRDYEIPEHLRGTDRFGIKAYQHPDLLAHARAESSSAEFGELLDNWATEYFRIEPDKQYWEGSPTSLWNEMDGTESITKLFNKTVRSAVQLGRLLHAMIMQGVPRISSVRTSKSRLYRIARVSS